MNRRINDGDAFEIGDHVRLSLIDMLLPITGPRRLPPELLRAEEPLTLSRTIAIDGRATSCAAMVCGDVEACGVEFARSTVIVASFRRAFTEHAIALEFFPAHMGKFMDEC
ncbi:hypothetical protein [Rhizocola hellebori]|nr:hypothetical protein [Rhizocola hellebori]